MIKLIDKAVITSKKFYNSIPNDYKQEAYHQYAKDGFSRIFVISIMLAIISTISILRDLFAGFYTMPNAEYNYCNLISFVAIDLFVIVAIILYSINSKKQNNEKVIEIVYLLYYIAMDIAMLTFFISVFMSETFLCFQLFYIFFLAAVPTLKLRHIIANFVFLYLCILVEYVVITLHNGFGTIDLFTNIIYLALIFIGGIVLSVYLRHYFLKNIISKYENLLLNRQLRYKSEIDELTGCYNRYALNEAFDFYKSKNESVALIMLDFDDFKTYNDAFSHVKGHECLQRVCSTIKNISGGYKFELYRYGGEEFLLLGIHKKGVCRALSYDILDTLRQLKLKNPEGVEREYMSVSLGACSADLDSRSVLSNVVARADEQLYKAKTDGKACAYYNGKKISL